MLPLIVHKHIDNIVAFEPPNLQINSISIQDDEVVVATTYTADLTGHSISLTVDLTA